MFAQQICRLALTEWEVTIERLSANAIELIADNALHRFPERCDVRFRNMAMRGERCPNKPILMSKVFQLIQTITQEP